MEDELYKSIMKGIAEMETLRADYEQKQSSNELLAACDNMINKVRCAVSRGAFPEKVEELKGIVTVMIEAQKYGNVIASSVMAEEAIFKMIEYLN